MRSGIHEKKTIEMDNCTNKYLSCKLVYWKSGPGYSSGRSWGAPTFIYGGGLTQDEINQTKSELGIQNQTIEEFRSQGRYRTI